MNKIGKKSLLFALLLFAENAFSSAPFITEDPNILPFHQSQITLYANAIETAHVDTTLFAPGFEFDFGLSDNIEIDTFFAIVSNRDAAPNLKTVFPSETGLGDADIEIKYRFWQSTGFEMAFVPNIYIPTGNAHRGLGNGRSWYLIPLSLLKKFNDWTLVGEIGYGLNSAPRFQNFFYGGAVLQKPINDKLTLGGEIFTQGRSANFLGSYTLLNIGMTYQVNPHFSLVASLGHTLLGQETSLAYLGLSWS